MVEYNVCRVCGRSELLFRIDDYRVWWADESHTLCIECARGKCVEVVER